MSRTSIDLTLIPNIAHYRRPNLVYSSGTVVSIETGLDGTSGDAIIFFPDGNLRTETSSSRYQATTSQNAVFTNATLGSNQGGIRSGAVANNTWYAAYAVKVTTFAANWVMVLDTVLPLQANYSTLNTNFGTNSWIYLGLVRNGDGGSTPSGILDFTQCGNLTLLNNPPSGQNTGTAGFGLLMATTAGATSLTWSYATGTGGAVLPNNINTTTWGVSMGASTGGSSIKDSASAFYFWFSIGTSAIWTTRFNASAKLGLKATPAASAAIDIMLVGFTDTVLGIGSNPQL